MSEYAEDRLTLLGKPISEETPASYYARISGYYAERARRTAPKEPVLKGKTKQTPTKKREGIYEITISGVFVCSFAFDKAKNVISLTRDMNADEKTLRAFLVKKKFSLDRYSIAL